MKKIFVILTVTLIVSAGFLGCNRHKHFAFDTLTGAKGWVLDYAYSDPRYFVESEGYYVTDLINDEYLKNFEVAYILIFNASGDEIVKPGSVVAPSADEGYITETTIGHWELDDPDDPSFITMQLPFLYKEGSKKCEILKLSKDEFIIKFSVQDSEKPAKKTCVFTLRYVPIK